MGKAARTPARCRCGAIGPQRGRPAIEAGWAKIGREWTCPPCLPVVEREEQEAFDQRHEAFDQRHEGLRLPLSLMIGTLATMAVTGRNR